MKRWIVPVFLLFGLSVATAVLTPSSAGQGTETVAGDSTVVSGGTVSTWARVNGGGKVIAVGVTVPLAMVENQPMPGPGPAGSVAVLDFPAEVQASTYFNHVEIHSNLHGHPANPTFADTNRYMAPHFDFHFYSIPVADVFAIPFVPPFPPLPAVPADRLPAGYGQPDVSILQMGRHSAPLTEYIATDTWELTMLSGFLPDASYMHFMEPMITREFLLKRKNFTLPVPMPAAIGRATLYPTEFVAYYDKDLDAYHFVYRGFEPIS